MDTVSNKPSNSARVPGIQVDTVSNPSNPAGGTWHTGGHSQQQSLQLCWGYLAYRWTQSATPPTLLGVPGIQVDTVSNPSNSAGGTWHTGGHSQQQSLQLCWRYLTHTWIRSQQHLKPTTLSEHLSDRCIHSQEQPLQLCLWYLPLR